MQRWMSRPAPRAKSTVNDWLVDSSNNLLWLAVVVVGLASVITSR